MPLIMFQPSNKNVNVPAGTELLVAARRAGVEIDISCGGKGTCGKCMVRILSGEVDSDSLGALPSSAIIDGYVLACKTKVLESSVVVEVPEISGRKDGKFTDAIEDTTLVRRELMPKKWHYDPLVVKWYVDVEPAKLDDGLSDLDRLTRGIQKDWGKKDVVYPLPVIRQVADTLRAENGKVTVMLVRDPDRYHVIGIEAGNSTVKNYGIAIDIGTTTIAVQLVFLPQAEIIATRSDYNDQITCGLDVISRINYARRKERLEELQSRVLGTINRLINQVAESHKVMPEEICNAVISGNTTMVHLLLGLNPEYIRLEPYTPTLLAVPYLTAEEIGININLQSWVYISPSVGSYVGGDITAGVLCTDLAADTEDVCLFIDIGTNGEIVIGNREFLMTCACSAGPAFEGGGIEFGMRASHGAIEKTEVDLATGVCKYWTISNAKPEGICGSGMISLLAELLLTGWVDAAGKLNREKKSPAISFEGKGAYYTIALADESAQPKAIKISERDIENIIRAKAAIYSACALMLNHVGMTFNDLDTVYIGGGFGRFLDLDKAKVIGLIPDLPKEKFKYIGNSSLMGGYMVLVSQEYRQKQLEIAKKMTYIDLSTSSGYMDQYTAALFLPHTDPELFPSVADEIKRKQNLL